jgi:hypothetical protein
VNYRLLTPVLFCCTFDCSIVLCSAQFPELHARMCKTYLDALSPDKTLGTLYGAIVGLSALGNHIVRTLLVPNLRSIQQRLQGVEVKQEGGVVYVGQDASMPPPAATGEPAGKRKRGNSIDGATGASSSASATASKAAATSSSSSGAAASGKRGGSKAALQEERDISMCKQALLRALGRQHFSLSHRVFVDT